MIDIDSSLLIVFLIVWILVVALNRIFFKPVREIVQKREEGLEQDRKAGEDVLKKHEENLIKLEDDMRQARAKAHAVRDKWERNAVREKERLLSEVTRECRAQVNEAKQELEVQLEALKEKLAAESGRIAEQIEKKLTS